MKYLALDPVLGDPGRVLQGGQRGPFVRSRRLPVQPRPQSQRIQRAAFRWAAATWLTLSEPEKDAWRDFGPVSGDGSVNIFLYNRTVIVAGDPPTRTAPSSGPPSDPVILSAAIHQTAGVLDVFSIDIEEPVPAGATVEIFAVAPGDTPDPTSDDWTSIGFAWVGGSQNTDFLAGYISAWSSSVGPNNWIAFYAVARVGAEESEWVFGAAGTPPETPEVEAFELGEDGSTVAQFDFILTENAPSHISYEISISVQQPSSSPVPTDFDSAYIGGDRTHDFIDWWYDNRDAELFFHWWVYVKVEAVSTFDSSLRSDALVVGHIVDPL